MAQSFEFFPNGTEVADGEVDVVALEHAAGDVGRVGFAFAKALDGGFFVAKGG